MGIEYDGSAYNGWQRQKTGDGVQAHVEAAVAKVANEACDVICAGRTDTGVHASGQVVHFDTQAERTDRSWLLGVNSELPADISTNWARPVDEEFHARFSAVARRYRYRILNRLARSALHRNRAWWLHQPLDAARMHEAAQSLVGEHDFSAFRAAGCQARTPIRELTDIAVHRNDEWVWIDVRANAFLQHMVRNITGTLVAVGQGEQPVGWVSEVLASRNRTDGGVAAPPQGLTLVAVEYPPDFGIPEPLESDKMRA
ncbi:MAG: tRNA pseudouridine(38-40) synthase TruA [Pseudomonadota bacterium]